MLRRPPTPQAALHPHVSLFPDATTAVDISLLLDSETPSFSFLIPFPFSTYSIVAGTFSSA